MNQVADGSANSSSEAGSGELNWYLVAFDSRASKLLTLEDFGQDQAALEAAHGELRRQHQATPEVEVTILSAESVAALKKTHARYFVPAPRLAVSQEAPGKELTL